MRQVALLLILSVTAMLPVGAGQALAQTEKPSHSCADAAAQKGLKGAERRTFLKTCGQGALAPAKPTRKDTGSAQARIVTAPSGADRTARSAACAAEARRQKMSANQTKAFRLSCMASAAPVGTTGGSVRAPTPTPAKPGYDTLPR